MAYTNYNARAETFNFHEIFLILSVKKFKIKMRRCFTPVPSIMPDAECMVGYTNENFCFKMVIFFRRMPRKSKISLHTMVKEIKEGFK